MILAVADTGPIHYLVLIGEIGLLPQLFDNIVIPQAVCDELSHEHAPESVKEWIDSRPAFIHIEPDPPLEDTGKLDPGEAAAIVIAKKAKADFVLLDDREAREIAVSESIPVIGTVGILESAAAKGLVELGVSFDRLLRTNFRISKAYLDDALRRDAARKGKPDNSNQ